MELLPTNENWNRNSIDILNDWRIVLGGLEDKVSILEEENEDRKEDIMEIDRIIEDLEKRIETSSMDAFNDNQALREDIAKIKKICCKSKK